MARRSTILIVDDNARNVNILRTILGPYYALASAGSGEQALALAPVVRPDLVLLDIMMPGLNGYDTCRRLRADPSLRWAKIIMVSAKAMISERLEGYDAGADDYVTKPFDQDELLAKVRVYLRLKSIEEVDALKSDVLSLLSHETRTPLTGIIGPAEILLHEDAVEVAERKEFARTILVSATKLHELFQKVMLLAELKAGTVTLEMAAGDLSTLLEETIAGAAAKAAGKGVTIQPVLAAAPVLMDAKRLAVAFAAILENAIRFSRPREAVVVGLDAHDGRARVTITDHGAGIAPAFLPRVFDEFTDAHLNHHDEGHGLSLAIARRLVQTHGGTIALASEPGAGTTVTIDLPIAASARAAGSAGACA